MFLTNFQTIHRFVGVRGLEMVLGLGQGGAYFES